MRYGLASALVSGDGLYRYWLHRQWHSGPLCCWLMLNPSTADGMADDPTIRKCVKYAQSWGYGAITVVNLFAYRATDPKQLAKAHREGGLDYVVGPHNNEHIFRAMKEAAITVAGWGQHGKIGNRAGSLKFDLDVQGRKLYALRLAKDGAPYHPLYLPGSLTPFLME